MNDIYITLTGNVVADPRQFHFDDGTRVTSLRLAATPRLFDRSSQSWHDGETSYYAVRCHRALADNVAQSVKIGQPVVVHGKLRIRSYEREGERRFIAEVEAVSVGHDLRRGVSSFQTQRGPSAPAFDDRARDQLASSTRDWELGGPVRQRDHSSGTSPGEPSRPVSPAYAGGVGAPAAATTSAASEGVPAPAAMSAASEGVSAPAVTSVGSKGVPAPVTMSAASEGVPAPAAMSAATEGVSAPAVTPVGSEGVPAAATMSAASVPVAATAPGGSESEIRQARPLTIAAPPATRPGSAPVPLPASEKRDHPRSASKRPAAPRRSGTATPAEHPTNPTTDPADVGHPAHPKEGTARPAQHRAASLKRSAASPETHARTPGDPVDTAESHAGRPADHVAAAESRTGSTGDSMDAVDDSAGTPGDSMGAVENVAGTPGDSVGAVENRAGLSGIPVGSAEDLTGSLRGSTGAEEDVTADIREQLAA